MPGQLSGRVRESHRLQRRVSGRRGPHAMRGRQPSLRRLLKAMPPRRQRRGAAAALLALRGATTPPAAAKSTTRRPGRRPPYYVELEPHGLLGVLDPPGFGDDLGFGVGARATVELA